MSDRLGIVGIPEGLDDVLALCAGLNVEPVFLVGPGDAPPRPGLVSLTLSEGNVGDYAEQIRDQSFAGLWSGSCEQLQFVQELAAALNLPNLPCLNDNQHAALPIAGATIFSSTDLEQLRDREALRLPIPAWVRAACTGGDSSCMRLDHPNDLSLASAKLRKRNADGQVRIQPVVDGPVYRLLAFKTGSTFEVAGLIEEDVTSSVYRVPLGMSMPAMGRDTIMDEVCGIAGQVNELLPVGWGYIELEFVDSSDGLRVVDVQCPARLDPHLRELHQRAQGIDLRRASMECALGRVPDLSPTCNAGAAFTWLLTRSGIVTGFQGVDEARQMPGVVEVRIIATEGDILCHVVDIPSRERGGYVTAIGNTAAEARERLEAARAMVWINTSPALF